MRCNGSQTTSTAVEPPLQARVAGVFETLLFARVLAPLAKGLGPLGEIAISSVAERVFVDSSAKLP